MRNAKKRNSIPYLLIVLGGLSAFGPFVTDFYLPVLPKLGAFFETTETYVSLSLSVTLIGLAFGQLVLGPLSDKYGRKKIIMFSLMLFIFATIGCLCATSIAEFIIARLMQGIAGAGGVVVSKSIATDLFDGEELAKFFAMLGAVHGLAPIFAPVFGGFAAKFFSGWKAIFVILLILGILLLFAMFFFKESMKDHSNVSIKDSFTFMRILKNRTFMKFAVLQALAVGIMFSFIASSSFIFQEHYQIEPLYYSFCFAGVALCLTIGASITPLFKDEKKALKVGITGFSIMGFAVHFVLNIDASVYFVELTFAATTFFVGLTLPTSMALAMEMEREHSGNASAVLGFGGFAVGGLVTPLTSLGDNVMRSTSFVIIACCVLAVLVYYYDSKNKAHSQ